MYVLVNYGAYTFGMFDNPCCRMHFLILDYLNYLSQLAYALIKSLDAVNSSIYEELSRSNELHLS